MIGFVLATLLGCSLCLTGIDFSYYQGSPSQSTLQCVYNNGWRFIIQQAQLGSTYNTNVETVYPRAKAAGFGTIDYYIYPSTRTGTSGVRDTISRLKAAGLLGSNTVWIDVEACENWYGADYPSNISFIRDIINAAISARGNRKYVGVYANWTQWQNCFGSRGAFSEFSDLQLWYPHYDEMMNMSDFQSFGGWTRANMKQYGHATTVCDLAVDRNFW